MSGTVLHPASSELEEAVALAVEAERRGLPVPDELQEELAVRELLRRGQNPWPTFRDYVAYANRSLLRYDHVPRMIAAAQDVLDGLIQNLLVLMPPRYFKTEVFGRLLISYVMHRTPYRLAGLSSYNASKALETSDAAQQLYKATGGRCRKGSEAKSFWGPVEGGTCWAVGIAEGNLGRGMHLGVCDDPMDPKNVRSLVYQQQFEAWWSEKWLSRREPGAQLILDMQRLGQEDPIGYLMRREVGERTEQAPMHWHVLVLDEIKSDDPLGPYSGPRGLPPTCTVIEDPRPVGAILSPQRMGPAEVKRVHSETASHVVSAQRQQRPMSPAGLFWKKMWFETRLYDVLPPYAYNGGKDWDTAYDDDAKNAASAYVESYRGPYNDQTKMFDVYIENVSWQHLEFPALVEWMTSLGGPHFVEAKASGKSAVQALKVYRVRASEVNVPGDKLARSARAQPAVASGRVYIRKQIYDALLNGEGQGLARVSAEGLLADSGGLDLNDAFVQALHRHLNLAPAKTGQRNAPSFA